MEGGSQVLRLPVAYRDVDQGRQGPHLKQALHVPRRRGVVHDRNILAEEGGLCTIRDDRSEHGGRGERRAQSSSHR